MNVAYAESGAIPSPTSQKSRQYRTPVDGLATIDWNSINVRANYSTQGLHPYPAKYIPQIPNVLINELSCSGETVLDNFCSSRAAMVEARSFKGKGEPILFEGGFPLRIGACLASRRPR